VSIDLLDIDPSDRRRYCECCGCPTLVVPDYTAQPEWAFAATACDLCEWENAALDESGNLHPKDGEDEVRNDGLSLEAARSNFARFLSIYDPDAPPVWRVSAPSPEILAQRKQLLTAYVAVSSPESADAYGQWLRIRELERSLRALLQSQQERDADIADGAL
jgi:hypothetical protein